MNADLWISVALAIPLAILANLLTPKIQRLLEDRVSKGKRRKAQEQLQKRRAQLLRLEMELSKIESLHREPAKLTNLNFNALLVIALYGAFGTIYGSLFALLGEFAGWGGPLGVLGRFGAQALTLFVAMLIFRTVAMALKTNRRVNDFENYKLETQKVIDELRKDS